MGGAQLSIRVSHRFAVAALRGDLDISDADDLAAALGALSAGGGCLVVDMSELEYIDCAALGALLRVRLTAAADGGEVILAGPHGSAARILEVTGIDHVFRIFGSLPEAVAAEPAGAAPPQR